MRVVSKQNPNRFSHSAGKMDDSAVGHDDQIQLGDRSSGISKVF
jgi:hypothetical protein